MKRRGFSTPELLFVIAIIAVLAGLLFPVFAHCPNHPDKGNPAPSSPPIPSSGTCPFVREDLSLGMAKESEIELWWRDPTGWTQTPGSNAPILRFPREPWPLKR